MTWVELLLERERRFGLSARSGRVRTQPRHVAREDVSIGAVTPFDIRMSADEAFGLRESVVFGSDRIFRTTVHFRRGRIVAGATVARAEARAGLRWWRAWSATSTRGSRLLSTVGETLIQS